MKWIYNNKDRKQMFFWMNLVLIRLQYNEWMQNVILRRRDFVSFAVIESASKTIQSR